MSDPLRDALLSIARAVEADAPVCPWCEQQGWGLCQHYDDTKNCVWRSL